MIKRLLFGTALLVFANQVVAQRSIDPTNCREGESVEYCTTHKKIDELKHKNPTAYAAYLQEQQTKKEGVEVAPKSGIVYTVPVVFHVLHMNGSENISRDQILRAVEILNRDYRLQNTDANNVHVDFQGLPADVEIEFALAQKAPNGQCFGGITRTVTPLTFDGSDGQAQVSAVVNGNDVYQGQWPPNKYMNVYVCDEIGGAAGYTFNPGGWTGSSMYYNGIFVLHNYLGDNGTSSVFTSRTLTHEVGHWLNLSHTWGPNNNPGNASSCGDDDAVNDTPNTIGVTSCNLNEASCGPRANVENYMDYSYCSKMFTPGQVTRMRNALTSSTAGRNNLWTSANRLSTGTNVPPALCKADFTASKTLLCVGDAVTFTDVTYNAASGWTWSFPGGTPATSTTQNPTVTYSTPGVYEVTLTATDGTTSDAETKTAYITVSNAPGTLPFYDGFENYTTLNGIPQWSVVNNAGAGFEITTSASHTGQKSVRLANFGQAADNIDELISSAVDLSDVPNNGSQATLTFRYAHAKRQSTNQERLKVFASPDCGDTWIIRKTLQGSALSTAVQTSNWTPTQSDWVTVHLTNITSSYWVENFKYKFEFTSDGGNNLFIDDINIYYGPENDNLVTNSIAEGFLAQGLDLFPNPANEEAILSFSSVVDNNYTVEIRDFAGKLVNQIGVPANSGMNKVFIDTEAFAAGIYFISLSDGINQSTLKLIKQ